MGANQQWEQTNARYAEKRRNDLVKKRHEALAKSCKDYVCAFLSTVLCVPAIDYALVAGTPPKTNVSDPARSPAKKVEQRSVTFGEEASVVIVDRWLEELQEEKMQNSRRRVERVKNWRAEHLKLEQASTQKAN